MKVTDIKLQVKRTGRYSIFFDSSYKFSLSENELVSSGIRIGKDYTTEEFDTLKQTAVLDKAYMRVIDLIARRPRSEWELRDYLKRKDYEPEIIDAVVERLSEAGYVNDADFARIWITNRRLLKSTSRQRLQLELRQKHISDEIISGAIEQDESNDQDVLIELVEKKRRQTRYQDDTKLMQYLSRQGFRYEDIKNALIRAN